MVRRCMIVVGLIEAVQGFADPSLQFSWGRRIIRRSSDVVSEDQPGAQPWLGLVLIEEDIDGGCRAQDGGVLCGKLDDADATSSVCFDIFCELQPPLASLRM